MKAVRKESYVGVHEPPLEEQGKFSPLEEWLHSVTHGIGAVLSLVGIACRLLWPQRFSILRVAIYLLMGWMIVLATGEMTANLSTTSMALLAAGGIAYTLGVIFYAVRTIPYNHAIWDLFVIAGSVCHYFAVYTAVFPSNSFASH